MPGLAVILVGDDPASQVYVRNKIKACAEAGIRSIQETVRRPTSPRPSCWRRIAALNADDAVHGILVQMPLPPHISAQRVIEAIDASKDVDGYSVESAGRLLAGLPGFQPCTPWGCMKLIESTGIALRGKHAVVIGRSNTVGKPMALHAPAGRRDRHRLPQPHARSRRAHPPGRRRRRRGRPRRTR